MIAERQLAAYIEGIYGERGVIAALRFQRNTITDPACQMMRPCACRNHGLCSGQRLAAIEHETGAVGLGADLHDFSLQEYRAMRHGDPTNGDGQLMGVVNGLPARYERTVRESGSKSGLQLSECIALNMADCYAMLLAPTRTRQRRLEFLCPLHRVQARRPNGCER